MLPEDIINNVMLFNSHPIADIMKEYSIVNYLQLRSYVEEDDDYVEDSNFAFGLGCWDALNGGGYSVDNLSSCVKQTTSSRPHLKSCVSHYTIGYIYIYIYMHTLKGGVFEDGEYYQDELIYNIKPNNIEETD